MKVLHVESGKHYYGGPLQVVLLMRGLAALGHENLLVCPHGSEVVPAARELGLDVAEIEMRGDLDIAMVPRLRQVIRAWGPDLVHLHSRRGADVWGGVAARMEGVPCLVSRRVDNPEPRWLAQVKYRLYRHVIAISPAIRDVLAGEGVPTDKIDVVVDAVDTDRFRPGCRDRQWFLSEFGLDEYDLVVAMVAQFIPRKGHHVLVDALPQVIARHPRVKVLLFGRGPEEEAVRRRVHDRGLAAHVTFAGFRADLDRVLPCVDVLVHPALMEGLGVAVLQAAASGVPVVASRVGGLTEAVHTGHTGVLVPPGDSQALADALLPLLGDPSARQRLGAQGRQYMLAKFSIPQLVQRHEQIYRRLVQSSHGSS